VKAKCLNCNQEYELYTQGTICPHTVGGPSSLPPWPKRSNGKPCHICDQHTELKCSDCMINLKAEVFVCENPKCLDEHEKRYCAGPQRQVAAKLPAKRAKLPAKRKRANADI
jgi:hypothetical protein